MIVRIFAMMGLLFLCGCKEVLFSNLHENEVNQMVAILDAAGMSSSRRSNSDGNYDLLVEASHVGVASLLLQGEGLPRPKFTSLGEVFADDGIVDTPFQERARFVHALNQELSATISTIMGVREARVHVVLPEVRQFDRTDRVGSAAIAIFYESGFNASDTVPTIKNLVAHSVPDLTYERVAVSLFEASGVVLHPAQNSFPGTAAASVPELAQGVLTIDFHSVLSSQQRIAWTVFFVSAVLGIWMVRYALVKLFSGSKSANRVSPEKDHSGINAPDKTS